MQQPDPQKSLGSCPNKSFQELRTLREGTLPDYPLQSVAMHNLHTSANLLHQIFIWCTGVQPHRLWGRPETENEGETGPLKGLRLAKISLQCKPIRQNDVDENGGERIQGFDVGRVLLATLCSMTYSGI